jgi:putative chitinase
MVSAEILKQLDIGEAWVIPLNNTFARFKIVSFLQQAAFIGQCGHECNNFKTLEENLHYKADTLMRLWPQRFPTLAVATTYANNPEKLANYIYGGRMGNEDVASGDGYRYRGRGCIQMTGRDNYVTASHALGADFVSSPELVALPRYAALTAGWYWDVRKCNELADRPDWAALTKKINGGLIGLDERVAQTQRALAVLKNYNQ